LGKQTPEYETGGMDDACTSKISRDCSKAR
jgi:hypothetical protein